MSSAPRSSGLAERAFSLLLRFYPQPFRARYQPDLLDTFRRDRMRPQFAGLRGGWRFWRHTVADVLVTGWYERRGTAANRAVPTTSVRSSFTGLWSDVRHSARGLTRQPGFAAVAILTLGLGVGATTTMFAIVDRVLLTPLPYPDADRLVRVYERERENPDARMVAYGNYADVRAQADSFEHLAIWANVSRTLTGADEARQLRTRQTSANFATTMGVQPVLGRWFDADAESTGADLAVLSHQLWLDAFGGDRNIVGQAVILSGAPVEVVGVMPAGFGFPGDTDIWIPLAPVAEPVRQRQMHRHNMIGRLADDVALGAAVGQLDTIAARLEEAHPDYNRGNYFDPQLLLDDVVADRRLSLVVLAFAVAALLAIACVNIASLTLARSVSRGRELALRAAIGASPGRLAALVAIEMSLLAAAGSLVGLGLSIVGVNVMLALGEQSIPRAAEVTALSWRVFAFAVVMSLACGLAVALLPVLRGRRLTSNGTATVLRGTRSSASRSVVRGRRVLVTAQLTIAFVLAAGAGLLLRSFDQLQSVDTGVTGGQVLTMNIQLPGAKYSDQDQVARFMDDLTARLEQMPGIERAGVTLTPPVNDNGWYNGLTMRDRTVPTADVPLISYVVASSGYLDTLGVPLVAGRLYEPGEPRGVVVINQAAAERHWPGEDPIGREILGSADDETSWARVIGIVGNVRQSLLRESVPEVFVPVGQDRVLGFVVVARTSGDALQQAQAVRAAINDADIDVPVTRIMSLDERIGLNVAQPKFTAVLISTLAGLAVLLAAAGVFGVVSYSVAERRKEFGIRLAVGASRTRVLGQVLREGLVLATVAVALGVVGARLAGRALEGLLFEVGAGDPAVYVSVGLTILAVTVAAGLGPARRATAADPLVVLREE